MIVREVINGLTHTYSNTNHTIIQVETGIEYGDAWDRVEHEYIESENFLEEEEIIPEN